MNLTDKMAYLRGMVDGMELDLKYRHHSNDYRRFL